MILETRISKEEIMFKKNHQIWPIWPFKGLGLELCPLPFAPVSPT
jgi:hypothetical protein